jgi:hypothetical protein
LINFKASNYAGVITPSGLYGTLDCSDYPAGSNAVPNNFNYPNVPSPAGSLSATGPDGVNAVGSNNIIVDGIRVVNCGLTSGNVVFFNCKVVEVSNSYLAGGGVRGIWIILTSNSAMQYNTIITSAKFAIDLDASSGPWSLIHSNYIADNSFQAVFIEQGTLFSVVSGNKLPRNQNGVSFFNNIYPELVVNHVILNNEFSYSTSSGINIGSISCQVINAACPEIVGFWPTADSYVIGNKMWNNKNAGYGSNGANQGSFVSHNLDFIDTSKPLPAGWIGTGLASSFFKVVPVSGAPVATPNLGGAPQTTGYFPDPFKRNTLVTTKDMVSDGKFCSNCANVTVHVDTFKYDRIGGSAVSGKTGIDFVYSGAGGKVDCADINSLLNGANAVIYKPDKTGIPTGLIWQWYNHNTQKVNHNVFNYVTLDGGAGASPGNPALITCKTQLIVPANTFLVLKNVKIQASSPFKGNSLIYGGGAHYSGVLSYGSKMGQIDCSYTASTFANVAGIRVFNSSFFQIDGLDISNCGNFQTYGSIDIIGGGVPSVGNSTEVAATVITDSKGPGVLVNRAIRAIIYNSTIVRSANSGVGMISGADRTIISKNTIRHGLTEGIYSDSGSTRAVIEANDISYNKLHGVKIAGMSANGIPNKNVPFAGANVSLASGVASDFVIIRNIIKGNRGSTVLMETNFTGSIIGTKILGNTMFNNTKGVTAKGAVIGTVAGISNTWYFGNADFDGLEQSVLVGSAGKALDPQNRAIFGTPLQTAVTIVGNISLQLGSAAGPQLQDTITWSPADLLALGKMLGIRVDPTAKGQVSVNYLNNDGLVSNLQWTLKYHKENEPASALAADIATEKKNVDALFRQAEYDHTLDELFSGSGAPLLPSTDILKAIVPRSLKHMVLTGSYNPEHAGYTSMSAKLGHYKKQVPVKAPTKKPKNKPDPKDKPMPKNKPMPKKGGKGGKEYVMEAFQSVMAVMGRAFSF